MFTVIYCKTRLLRLAMPSVAGSTSIDSDQENTPSNANMSRKTPQQRKLTYRNLLNKVEGIRK